MWIALLLLLLAPPQDGSAALRVRAIQHRGWWELRYPDGTVAANELHVPAGRAVRLEAQLDGAGLLWLGGHGLPRLGRGADVRFTASRGERSIVRALHVAQPRVADLAIIADDRFDQWLAAQKSVAAPPANALVARGREVFLTARCTLCHTVRGVAAAEEPVGPDLTHVASRSTLAAGVLPNRTGHLAGWIVDAETLKPGAGMPVNNIASPDLKALLAFVRSLR